MTTDTLKYGPTLITLSSLQHSHVTAYRPGGKATLHTIMAAGRVNLAGLHWPNGMPVTEFIGTRLNTDGQALHLVKDGEAVLTVKAGQALEGGPRVNMLSVAPSDDAVWVRLELRVLLPLAAGEDVAGDEPAPAPEAVPSYAPISLRQMQADWPAVERP